MDFGPFVSLRLSVANVSEDSYVTPTHGWAGANAIDVDQPNTGEGPADPRPSKMEKVGDLSVKRYFVNKKYQIL